MSIEVRKKQEEPMFKVASAPVAKSFSQFEQAVIKNPPVVSKPVKKKDLPKAVPKYLAELFKLAMVHDKVTGCPQHPNANAPCIEYTCAKYLGINQSHTHEEIVTMLKDRGIYMVPDYYSLKCGVCKTKGASYKFTGEINFMKHMIDNHQDTYTLTTITDMIGTLEKNSVTPGRQIDIKLDSNGKPLTEEHAQYD